MSENITFDKIKEAVVVAPHFFFCNKPASISGLIKPSYQLLGVPVIVRVLRQLQDAGVKKTSLIMGAEYKEIKQVITNDFRISHDVKFDFIGDDEFDDTLQTALKESVGGAYICRSDLIAPPQMFEAMNKEAAQAGMVVATDDLFEGFEARRLTGFEDRWKVTNAEKVHPPLTGIFTLSADLVQKIGEGELKLSEAVESCNENNQISVFTTEAFWSQIVGVKNDIAKAEKKLLKTLRKPIDGIIARLLNRNISIPISKAIVNTPITPNMATLATLIFAMIAVWMVVHGGYLWMLLGAAVFQFASIVDGVDGELARLKYMSSKVGEWMDTVCDDISNWSFIAAITYTVWIGASGPAWLLPFGLITEICYLYFTPMMYAYIIKYTDSGDVMAIDFDFDEVKTKGVKDDTSFLTRILGYLRYAAKRDFYIFGIFMFALFGVLPYFLVFSGITTAIVSVLITMQHKQRRDKLKSIKTEKPKEEPTDKS